MIKSHEHLLYTGTSLAPHSLHRVPFDSRPSTIWVHLHKHLTSCSPPPPRPQWNTWRLVHTLRTLYLLPPHLSFPFSTHLPPWEPFFVFKSWSKAPFMYQILGTKLANTHDSCPAKTWPPWHHQVPLTLYLLTYCNCRLTHPPLRRTAKLLQGFLYVQHPPHVLGDFSRLIFSYTFCNSEFWELQQ